MSAIKVRHDLRDPLGPARDQGVRSTCLAFATSDVHAAARGKPWKPLSCEYLFYHAKQRDKTAAQSGATIPSIRAALEQDGQPIESAWPYLSTLPADMRQWRPPKKIGTIYRRSSITHFLGFDAVWSAVESDQPVLICMTLSSAFYTPSTYGIVDSAEPTDGNLRHAVIAVATGARSKNRFILVRNSWGETWGQLGHAWLSQRYLTPRIIATLTIK